MPVALRIASPRARRYSPRLRRDAAKLLSELGLARTELSLILVDDDTIRGLNREFRNKDSATDVLSFSQLEEVGGPPPDPDHPPKSPGSILGDVVISIDTALRQAKSYGVSPAVRLRTLLIHGTLHLMGHDHERSRADARAMFRRERELASAISKTPKRRKRKSR